MSASHAPSSVSATCAGVVLTRKHPANDAGMTSPSLWDVGAIEAAVVGLDFVDRGPQVRGARAGVSGVGVGGDEPWADVGVTGGRPARTHDYEAVVNGGRSLPSDQEEVGAGTGPDLQRWPEMAIAGRLSIGLF